MATVVHEFIQGYHAVGTTKYVLLGYICHFLNLKP